MPIASNVQLSTACSRAAFCHTSKRILTILRAHGKPMASQGAIRVIKIRFSWIHDIFKFEESAPFSYTCHNCDVPWRVVLWGIGSVLVHVSQLCNLWFIGYFKMLIKPKEFQWIWCVPLVFHCCNLHMRPSQIGIRWSGTRNRFQRYEIDHFCQGIGPYIRPSEIPS